MANPIELNYPLTGRNVCCIRVAINENTASPKVYNTSTQLYETYNASNDSLYQINLTETIPHYYRAVCPSGSLSIPATELYFDMAGASVLDTTTHKTIGQGNSQGVNIGTINGQDSSLGDNPTAIVDICNLALTHIGQKKITSLSASTENARVMNRIYTTCRDEVLRRAKWKFAQVLATLTELEDETFVGWNFVYTFPSDCIKIDRVFSDDSNQFDLQIFSNPLIRTSPVTDPEGIPYKVFYDTNISLRVIVANDNPAYIMYTARVTDPAVYDALFIKALSFKLAAEAANPLCGDSEEAKEMTQRYELAISEAARVNGGEDGVPRRQKSNYIDIR